MMQNDPELLIAEFDTPKSCMKAAAALRDAGYTRFDAHTPFPIHGMDAAMGLKDTPIGWLAFFGGIIGCSSAFVMMWWMNAVDYPIVVGGKPPFSIHSMIPVMFELTILLTGFATFFGLLHLARLPRHHHPIFYSDRFRSASDHKFFVSVGEDDPNYDLGKTRALLDSLAPSYVERVLPPEKTKGEVQRGEGVTA